MLDRSSARGPGTRRLFTGCGAFSASVGSLLLVSGSVAVRFLSCQFTAAQRTHGTWATLSPSPVDILGYLPSMSMLPWVALRWWTLMVLARLIGRRP